MTAQTGEGTLLPPILRHKRYDEPSVFAPENLLREARRQKAISAGAVPRICVLDPDGDIVPPGLIERVEILTDGGSAIYGSDAVAGVINFITCPSSEHSAQIAA